ncbi:unnamed protein product [Effrenium voratum]|uniref:DUF7495 domain-containing protein n=1 Tax=Effrenium voratum TaxID=2562239 RepID=A0AA36JAD0_9DINO|nr:unnamed protein product [Effrenium voratum]CAJ1440518.1 unnamed protein product [Effrenium voratum]
MALTDLFQVRLVLRVLSLQLCFYVARSYEAKASGLVMKLQDSLASGLYQDSLASPEAIVRSVRKAAPGEKIQELLSQINTTLDSELSQMMFEESRSSGSEELRRLRERFEDCRHGVQAVLLDDSMRSSHRSCRLQEAAARAALQRCQRDCQSLEQAYHLQRKSCNEAQDALDSAICAQQRRPCDHRLACEAKALDAMNTAMDTIEAQEREYFGLSKAKASVACLLSSLRRGEDAHEALAACQTVTERRLAPFELPALPELSPCEPAHAAADYRDLPKEAPAKPCSSACCASLLQDSNEDSDDFEEATKTRVAGKRNATNTTLQLEAGYVLVRVLEKSPQGEVSTITKQEFNERLEPTNKNTTYPLVKRICPSCAATHTEIFYRRYTPLKSFSPYEALACAWNEDVENVQGKDFKIFSNLNDALADKNAWTSCTYSPQGSGRGFPNECGPKDPVGEQWNSVPVDAGVANGKCSIDKGGRAVSYYMLLPIVPQKFRVGLSVDKDGHTKSLGGSEFNRRFQESRYHIIKRTCESCSKSHKYIYYRRLTNVDTYEPYKTLACDWQAGADNAFMVDFKLFSTLQDALADDNAWDYCGFDSGSGFPGSCSPTGKAKTGQSNYLSVRGCTWKKSDKAVTFELYEDEDLEIEAKMISWYGPRPDWSKKAEVDNPQFAIDAGDAKDLVKDTGFTMMSMVRRDEASGPLTIFSAGHDSSSMDVDLRAFSNSDSTFSFRFSGQECTTAATEKSEQAIWQHVAFTYDMKLNETRIYLNGLEVKACPFPTAYSPDDAAKMMVGAYKTQALWGGALKEMKIWGQSLSGPLMARLAGDLAMPQAMVWFSHVDGWSRTGFGEAVGFCAKHHMKLAHYEDYCKANSEGVLTVNPRVAPGDQWAPFASEQGNNSWVQIGNGASTKNPVEACKSYEQEFGEKPAWGLDGKANRYKSFLACKAWYGFIMYPEDKGQGKCEGEVLPQQNEAKSEAACKMHCVKEQSCHFASFVGGDSDSSCTLFSTCDSWSKQSSSTTFVKKPLR